MLGILVHIMRTRDTELVIRRARAGLGLFTCASMRRGEFIIEYVGEHITHDEADRRGGKYLFTINEKVVIDGKKRSNLARYINHSCAPNAEAESDDDEEKIRIYATKNIDPGEEITIDYGKEYWEDQIKPYGCKCAVCG